MLLSPISLIGRVNKISSSWMVLTKPVRHRMLYDTMHKTIGADLSDTETQQGQTTESKAGGHVLLVEESQPVAQLLQNILRENGYRVAHVSNSESAKLSIHVVNYDLCLMALPLSGDVDIGTLTHEIRSMEAEVRPRSPRLVMVGMCATQLNTETLAQSGKAQQCSTSQ
jgi:CheY-like chemotaxis protein